MARLLQRRDGSLVPAAALGCPQRGDYWARVATYHSATPKYNAIYRSKLIPLSARWGRWLQANYTTSTSYH